MQDGSQQKIMPESAEITRFDVIPSVDLLTLCVSRKAAAEKEVDSSFQELFRRQVKAVGAFGYILQSQKHGKACCGGL